MSAGLITFGEEGEATRPSPSVWKDCRNTLLNDLGLGVYAFEDFLAEQANATPADGTLVGSGVLAFKGDTDTVLSSVADHRYGAIALTTDTTAGDGGALVSRVFGRITKNSGERLWLEARLAPGDVNDDLGTFFGLVEEDGATHDVIADDPATDASVVDGSLIGFFQNNADANAFDIVKRIAGGTVATIKSDVTNATGIPSDERASLFDNVFVKLGIRFDGHETITFYANGYKVATQTVDSTIDQSQDYAVVLAVKTGDAAAEQVRVDWVRYAFQQFS